MTLKGLREQREPYSVAVDIGGPDLKFIQLLVQENMYR